MKFKYKSTEIIVRTLKCMIILELHDLRPTYVTDSKLINQYLFVQSTCPPCAPRSRRPTDIEKIK